MLALVKFQKKFNDLVHLIIKEIIQYIPKEDRI